MNIEDLDDFIKQFRRFHEMRNKWGIIDSDIYNIDKSESSISMKQAFIDQQIIDGRVKQQEIQSLQKVVDNRKLRSKKIIGLKIINAETYTTYCK